MSSTSASTSRRMHETKGTHSTMTRSAAVVRSAIAAAIALYLDDEVSVSNGSAGWPAVTRPDEHGAGRPWITGSDAWRWAERPR